MTESNLMRILKGRNTNSNDSNKFGLGIFYMLFKCFFKRDSKIKYYLKSKAYITEKLSVENILKTFVNFDLFKKIILNDNQLRMFNFIPKQPLKKLRNIDSNNLKDFNANTPNTDCVDLDKDEISRKLFDLYKN